VEIAAVLFDFGGVILSSPFDAFAELEKLRGLPPGSIRRINATNHHGNAWAKLERSEVGLEEFSRLFEAEAAALGHELSGQEVLNCLRGEIRPQMVEAIRRLKSSCKVGLLTNNFVSGNPDWSSGGSFGELLGLFDEIVESSVVGVRKPEPEFYEIALSGIGVSAEQAVFLDDLGVNLKPAAAMGMRTIKVVDPDVALAELGEIVGMDLLN
jgi:putative hydrolase of the HAD superfamily